MNQQPELPNKGTEQSQNQKWYQVGMMWLAVGLPSIVVVASLITVVIAHKNAPLINHGVTPTSQQGSEN